MKFFKSNLFNYFILALFLLISSFNVIQSTKEEISDNLSKNTLNGSKEEILINSIYDNFEMDKTNNNKRKTINEDFHSKTDPLELVNLTKDRRESNKININLQGRDPIELMRMKAELMNLYLPNNLNIKKKKDNLKNSNLQRVLRFKQQNHLTSPNVNVNNADLLTTDPTKVGKISNPSVKEYKSNEEIVPMINLSADSYYVKTTGDQRTVLTADSILSDDDSFWCSYGSHALDSEIHFYLEFGKPFRINAFWIQWAMAPAQFRVRISNNKDLDKDQWVMLTEGFINTLKDGDINRWKSIISNPKTRWQYKSFDQRIDLDEPVFATYVEITMRIPVNQYFGISKIEFYTKTEALVMIKSKKPNENTCLSVANGQLDDNSPVIAVDCLQALSYGDNRDIFVLHSNGFITTFNKNKCLQSPSFDRVNIVDCAISSDFKDDREKWLLDADGKIRSLKEEFTCLSIADMSYSDEVLFQDRLVSASSTKEDGMHDPVKAIEDNFSTYWASNEETSMVVFEVKFAKYAYTMKSIQIDWMFPPKEFKILGLFPDGFWRVYLKTKNHSTQTTFVNMENRDLMAIKIEMYESAEKVDGKNVFGIKNIALHTGGRFLRREACKDIILNSNIFEIIDVELPNKITGDQFKQNLATFHHSRTKLQLVESLYSKIPILLLTMKRTSEVIANRFKKVTEAFDSIKKKLNLFDEFLQEEKLEINTLGTSEYFPVIDCSHIINSFPSKHSGYYWIKNDCMEKAQRVYCDFDSYDNKNGLDYLIFNDNQPINVPFSDVFNSYLDIRAKCASIGMEALEIKNVKMLNIVFNLLKIQEYNLDGKFLIPIAYDYNCDISQCSKIFKSLNDNISEDITDIINQFKIDNGSTINYIFSSGLTLDIGTIENMAGFGHMNNISYNKLNANTISAVVCSSNQEGKISKNSYYEMDCNTNLRSEKYQKASNFRVLCPSNCAKENSFKVYGTDIYTDNSSVCRAAVHSGVIKDSEGGLMEVIVEAGKDVYIKKSRFGVDSLDAENGWDRSFVIRKFTPYCPIDSLKDFGKDKKFNKAISFIETNEESNFNLINKEKISSKIEKNNEIENIKNEAKTKLINEMQSLLEHFKSVTSQNKELLNDSKTQSIISEFEILSKFLESNTSSNKKQQKDQIEIKNANNESYFFKDTLGDKLNDKSNNKIDGKYKQSEIPTLSNLNNEQSSSLKLNSIMQAIQNNKNKARTEMDAQTIRSIVDFDVPRNEMNTEQALKQLEVYFNQNKAEVLGILKISDNFKTAIGKVATNVNTLNFDPLYGVINQKITYNDYSNTLKQITQIIFEIDKKIQHKLRRTEFSLYETKRELDKLSLRDPFTEDFSSKDIFDKYTIYNSKKGKGNLGKWDYFNLNVNGHQMTIKQSENFMDNSSGTHLIINKRDYYDFELKTSFNLKDDKTFGIAFRYKNPYNYYIFELSNIGKGYKRVKKYKKGKSEIIDEKSDGGFIQDTWYNLKIRGQNGNFEILMTDQFETGSKKEIPYEKVFSFYHNELVHGTIAFTSNGMRSLLIDNISIVPLYCTNYDTVSETISVITNSCIRFRETFKNGFNLRWQNIDPDKDVRGSSLWILQQNIDGREFVLSQNSIISKEDGSQEGSLYILKDDANVCNSGKFILNFKALDTGIIGLVFKYDKLTGNYYILEISGDEKDSFIRLRKKINNQFLLISSNPVLFYIKDVWFRIILTIEKNGFNAFFSSNSASDNLIQVFPEKLLDLDINSGILGISTFRTRAYFDEINAAPFDDLESHDIETNLFIDEEALDCKIYNILFLFITFSTCK